MAPKSKTSGKVASKPKITKNGPTHKNADVKVKVLGKSTLIEEDLQATEKKLDYVEPETLKGERKPQLFYRNFVFKCGKCIKDFKHETAIPIIEHQVVCPTCNEVHLIRVIPVARHYELKLPKNLKAVRHSKD
jgi:Zn finger protein HypA/HybF involved in hydrogenase expression